MAGSRARAPWPEPLPTTVPGQWGAMAGRAACPIPRVADINMAQLSRAASCSACSSCRATFAGNWSRGPRISHYRARVSELAAKQAIQKYLLAGCTTAPNQFSTNFICSKHIGRNLRHYQVLLHSVRYILTNLYLHLISCLVNTFFAGGRHPKL